MLAFSHNKKYRALVIRAWLNECFFEAKNMVQVLPTEKDIFHSKILCVPLLGGQRQITNEEISREFCDYFQKLFT